MDSVSAQALNKALGERPREVFRHLVEAFLASGEPVGSRTLSQRLPLTLSPASIRNVMADLEAMGLLYAPHTSAGRVPTEKGLRLFVDGLLEIGELAPDERVAIEARMSGSGRARRGCADPGDELAVGPVALRRACRRRPSRIRALKHIEFVAVAPGKALVVMVSEDGQVENRLIDTPLGLPPSALSRSLQLSQCAAARPHARCGARAKSCRSWKASAPNSTARPPRSWPRVWRPCRVRPAAAQQRGKSADRARRLASARHGRGAGRYRARAHPVRRHRAQERPDPPAGTGQGRRRRAHLHRLGEPAVQPVRFVHRGRALCQCRRARSSA